MNSLLTKALAALKNGKFDRARTLCRRTLKTSPNDFDALHLLGCIFLQTRQPKPALRWLLAAERINPSNPDLQNNLSLAYSHLAEPHKAIDHVEAAVRLAPDSVEFLNNSASIHLQVFNWREAAEAYAAALRRNPYLADVWSALGTCQRMLGDLNEALRHQLRALEMQPLLLQALAEVAAIYEIRGDQVGALESIESALEIGPENVPVLQLYANTLGNFGRVEECLAVCEKITDIDPLNIGAFWQMAYLGYFDSDQKIERLESSLDKIERSLPRSESAARARLDYIRHSAYKSMGAHDRTRQYLHHANTKMRRSYRYDIEWERSRIERIKQNFEALSHLVESETGLSDEREIFVIGMPRSGTSLTEQIIAAHSQVYGAGEQIVLDKILADCWSNREYQYDTEFLRHLAERYRSSMSAYQLNGIRFVVDKYPHNFLHVGMIRYLFPGAKVVHSVRNPMATCFSIYEHFFDSTGHGYSNDLEEIGEFFSLYSDLMAFWHRALPGFIYDLSYEALTENLVAEVENLLEFLGLPWEPGCVEFHNNERAVRTLSLQQVRSPIHRRSINVWQDYRDDLLPLIRVLEAHGLA